MFHAEFEEIIYVAVLRFSYSRHLHSGFFIYTSLSMV